MIKRLKIKNLQSHRNTELEFHPNFSVISGASDSGKSSLIRALRWVIENKPQGWEFKSWFKDTKETSVEVETDGGAIKRKRTSTINAYEIGKDVYEAVRGNVPDQVKNILQMDSINIQTQFNDLFMLQKSPGEVASMLNKVAGLEIIDKVRANINSIVDKAKASEESQKETNEDTIKKIEAYAFLDQVQPLLLSFESNLKTRDALFSTCTDIQKKVVEYTLAEMGYKSLSKFLADVEPLYLSINKLNEEVTTLKLEADSVENQIFDHHEYAQRISIADKILKADRKYQSILKTVSEINTLANQQSQAMIAIKQYMIYAENIKKADSIIGADMLSGELKTLLMEISSLDKKKKDILTSLVVYNTQLSKFQMTKSNLDFAENEYQTLLTESGICPMCGNTVSKENLEHWREHQ